MNIFLYLNCTEIAEKTHAQLGSSFPTFRFTDIENLVKTLTIYKDGEDKTIIIDKQNRNLIPHDIAKKSYIVVVTESPSPIEEQDVRFDVEVSYDDLNNQIMTILSYHYAMKDVMWANSIQTYLDGKYGNILYTNMLDRLKVFYSEIIEKLSHRESVILCGNAGTGKTYILDTIRFHKLHNFILINKEILDRDAILSKMIDLGSIPYNFVIGVEGLEELDEKIQQHILKLAYNKKNTFIITTRLSHTDAINKFPRFTRYFTHIYTLPTVKEYDESEVLSLLIKWIGNAQTVISKQAQDNIVKYPFQDNLHELRDLSRYIRRRNVDIVKERDLPIHLCEANKFLATSSVGNNDFLEILNKKIYNLATIERAMVKAVLRKNLFNKTRSSEELGISKESLNTKIRTHELTPEEVLGND